MIRSFSGYDALRYLVGALVGCSLAALCSVHARKADQTGGITLHGRSPDVAPASGSSLDFKAQADALLKKTAAGVPLGRTETRLLGHVVRQWIASDPVNCLNYLRSVGRMSILDLLGEHGLAEALWAASSGSLAQAINLSSQVLDGTTRDRLLQAAFATAALKDFHQIPGLLGRVPLHLQERIFPPIAAQAVRGGESTVRALVQTPGAPISLLQKVFTGFCASDPVATARLLSTCPELDVNRDPSLIDARSLIICDFLNQNLPLQQLRTFVEALPPGREKESYWKSVVGRMASEEPAAFQGALAHAATPGDREEMLRRAFFSCSNDSDPRLAASIAEMYASPARRVEAAQEIAFRLAEKDPSRGVAWADGVAEPMARSAALHTAMEAWLARSPEAALQYAAGELQAGNKWIATVLPEALSQLFATSADGEMYRANLADVTRKLNQMDPAAKSSVAATLQQSLSPDRWKVIAPLLRSEESQVKAALH